MKKIIAAFLAFGFIQTAFSQEAELPFKSTIKFAPTGLPGGNISLQSEYHLKGKHSLTTKIGIPLKSKHTLQYEDSDADFTVKAFSFLAGYRTYLSKKHMRGLYFEPYFKYVHHTGTGVGNGTIGNKTAVMQFDNDYTGAGIGAQIGAQFIISNRIAIDLFFLGPEINTAKNSFKAVEVSSIIPWTEFEAADAERDIREFIDEEPFIRNRTTIKVDNASRTVTADFKGALPGFRAGLSVGIAL